MNVFVSYLLELMLVSGIFCLGYHLIRKHTTPKFKRVFLLAGLAVSMAFPLISIDVPAASPVSMESLVINDLEPTMLSSDLELPTNTEASQPVVQADKTNLPVTSSGTDWGLMAFWGYILVSLFLLARIALGIYQIWKLRSESICRSTEQIPYYEVSRAKFRGASFFNWIFIGAELRQERKVVLRHEQIHRQLFHSFDVLLSHLYCAFFWINPFGWILRNQIRVNTELEADACYIGMEDKKSYADTLLSLSQQVNGSVMMNHFSARFLKTRIISMINPNVHKNWVSAFASFILVAVFFLVSCDNIQSNSEIAMEARLNDVKSITTRFISHQSDTQQKTGKIVSIATFLPDGQVDEFVTQTTYPYDHEFEVKKEFWDEPNKALLPFIMDGLSLDAAENNFLYGNTWPAKYAQFLKERSMEESSDFDWIQTVQVDNESQPGVIKLSRLPKNMPQNANVRFSGFFDEFEYDEEKITQHTKKHVSPEMEDHIIKAIDKMIESASSEEERNKLKERRKLVSNNEQISNRTTFSYLNDKLESILIMNRKEHRFYYENDQLVKSEFYVDGKLFNTRYHYFKNGLKDRTEIFNTYNEPEYTITYTYEYW